MSDIEFKIVAHVFVVEALNGLLGAFRSIFSILGIWIVVADETELAILMFSQHKRLDVSVLREQLSDLNIGHINWNVFHIDVVDQSSHLASVLWLELDSYNLRIGLSFINSFLSSVLSIKAYETVSSRGMVLIHGDLERFNVTILLKFFMKIGVCDVRWNVSDENVLALEFLSVCSKELSIKLETSACFAVNLEVLHLVTGLFEFLVIRNVDNGSPEWACNVLSNLRPLLEVTISLALEGHSDFLGINFFLWKVVKIDQILLFGSHDIFVFV